MREVLTHSALFLQNFGQRSADGGGLRIKGELAMDAAAQIGHGGKQWTAFTKTWLGKVAQRHLMHEQRTAEDKLAWVQQVHGHGITEQSRNLLPGRRLRRIRLKHG